MLILGSEHLGMRTSLKKVSTDFVYIAPGIPKEEYVFPMTLLDSLNVSVSCGIFMKILKNKIYQANS